MSQLGIETELDSKILASKDEYAVYFKLIQHVLECLLKSQHELSKAIRLTEQEIQLMEEYFKLFLQSLTAFRLRYLYDNDHKLQIDTTESGFPNNREFMYLFNELQIREEQLTRLPSKQKMQKKMLDYLFEQKQEIPQEMMQLGALIEYYSRYTQSNIYHKFVQSKLLKSDDTNYPYMVSWSFYDSFLNRQFIYYMYFTYSGQNIEADKEKLFEVIKTNGLTQRELSTTATLIDRDLETIHPKLLKCIDIGPLYSIFSRDDNPITHVILSAIQTNQLSTNAFALEVALDILESVDEKPVTSGAFLFKKDQIMQIYSIPSNNPTAVLKGASKCYNYLLAPHRVIQQLNTVESNIIKKLSTSPIIIPDMDLQDNEQNSKKL